MLLISAKRAAAAIGSSCKTVSGAGEEALLETLRLITPHAEGLANVETFMRGVYTDTFPAIPDWSRVVTFRLSNGFLSTDTVSVSGLVDRWGEPIASNVAQVDAKYGTVTFFDVGYGTSSVKITYTSGFEVEAYDNSLPIEDRTHPDIDYRVYKNVPDFLASAVVAMLSTWQRNGLLVGKAVPKDVNTLIAMNDTNLRALKSRMYANYMRPRASMIFSESYRAGA